MCNFRKLFTGNVIAQLFLFGISPALSRIYTSEQFGLYAFYTSALGVLLVVSTFAFEKIILLLENSKTVLNLCFIIVACWFVGGSSLYFFTDFSPFAFIGETNKLVIFLFGAGLFAASVQQFLTYEMMRQNRYDVLSQLKIYQAFGNGGSQLGLAKIGFPSIGLIAGDAIGRIIGAIYVFTIYLKSGSKQKQQDTIWNTIKNYHQYPLFCTPSLLFNSLALQAPTFFFMMTLGADDTGLFSFTQKMVAVPIALFTMTLSQVFYGHASHLAKKKDLQLQNFFQKMVRKAFLVAVIPMLLFGLFAPTIFSIVFGEEWRVAGELAQIMTPLFIAQLTIVPVSQILYITTQQRVQFFWDIGRFLALTIGFLLLEGAPLKEMVLFYCIVMTVSYAVLYLLGTQILARKGTKSIEGL